MSSHANRGATSAGKAKLQNVNQVYAGKNQSLGGKSLGRNGGLTAIGKASGVVRRMPPPATLPSLKAECHGQDPDVPLVPQGGTGWSKTEIPSSLPAHSTSSHATESRSTLSSLISTSSNADLRPTWAKPQVVAAEAPPRWDFPSLAAGQQASKPKTWRSSGSTSEEPLSELPARFYEGGSASSRSSGYVSTRFQGSSDARVTSGRWGGPAGDSTSFSAREERNSVSDHFGEKSNGDVTVRHEEIVEMKPGPPPLMSVETGLEEKEAREVAMREAAMDKAQQKRAQQKEEPRSYNGVVAEKKEKPQPEFRLLRRAPSGEEGTARPAPVSLLARAVEDDEEQLKMTKLSSSASRVMKRVAPSLAPLPDHEPVHATPREKHDDIKKVHQEKRVIKPVQDTPTEEAKAPSPPTPPPAENIWEKRKEERASSERERAGRAQRGMQDTLVQHFPSVAEAASMRVDKDSTRKPADADFTRAALRARRGPVVNDVRALQDDGDDTVAHRNRPVLYRDRPREYEERPYDRGDYGRGDYNRREYGRERGSEGNGGERHEGQRLPQEEIRPVPREERNVREDTERKRERAEEQEEEDEHRGPREFFNSRARGRGGRGNQRGVARGSGYTGGITERRRPDEEKNDAREEAVTQVEKEVEGKKEEVTVEKESTTASVPREAANKEHPGDDIDRRGSNRSSQRGGRGRGGRGRGGNEDRRNGPRLPEQRAQKTGNTRRWEQDEGVPGMERGDKGGDRRMGVRPARGLYAPRPRRNNEPKTNESVREVVEEIVIDDANEERREARIKSPPVSSEGHEEWETASESSQRPPSQRRSLPPQGSGSKQGYGIQGLSAPRERLPKNGQPASRTSHARSENNRKPAEKGRRPSKETPESDEESVDRLAGLDLDNERVVVIDYRPSAAADNETGDFEEVLSKKAKRARAEEERIKKESEERRKQREKERSERALQKKQAKTHAKMGSKDEKKRAADDKEGKEGSAKKEDTSQLITTVWNSAQPEARAALEGSIDVVVAATVEAPPVLPSPIARPKSSKAAPAVEMPPVSGGRSTAADGGYQFVYDDEMAQAHKKEKENNPSDDSEDRNTLAASEAGSAVTDDQQTRRIGEALTACKNLWNGKEDAASPPALPSNIAKVKPQPQSIGEDAPRMAASSDVRKNQDPLAAIANTLSIGGGMGGPSPMAFSSPPHMGSAPLAPRSPAGMASVQNAFTNSYSFPFMLGEIGGGNGFSNSLAPATSPPTLNHSNHSSTSGYRGSNTGMMGMPPLGMPPPPMQRQPFDHSLYHPPTLSSRVSSMGTSGWGVPPSAPFDSLLTSSTPPPPMHNESMATNRGGPQYGNGGGRFSQPPPSGYRPPSFPSVNPSMHLLKMGGPSVGAVGERNVHNQMGGFPHSNSFSMPPPMANPPPRVNSFNGGMGSFTRPPPSIWKDQPPPNMCQPPPMRASNYQGGYASNGQSMGMGPRSGPAQSTMGPSPDIWMNPQGSHQMAPTHRGPMNGRNDSMWTPSNL